MRLLLSLLVFASWGQIANAATDSKKSINIRTESRAHPPYSGSTYYIYERDGAVICTKVTTCNKYDECSTEYREGAFVQDGDGDEAFDTKPPVPIAESSLKKHICLKKFKLI